MSSPILDVSGVSKTFTMHLRGSARLPVLSNLSFALSPSECLALVGPSGTGKSSLLRMIYGNYRCDVGQIRIRAWDGWCDLASAEPRMIHAVRRRTLGYISQFLRVIPRVSTLAIVSAAGREVGLTGAESERRASALLERLNIASRLWTLPPATFSGGEQQRVNIARGLIGGHSVLLVDEPTASLDAANRDVVVTLLLEAKARGTALLGIFHDSEARSRIADRELDLTRYAGA